MLNRLTRTKRRDATVITEDEMKEMKHLYYKEGIKTNELCKRYRIGMNRVVRLLNGDKSEIGGYTHRVSSGETRKVANFASIKDDDDDCLSEIARECNERMAEINKNKDDRLKWLTERTTC